MRRFAVLVVVAACGAVLAQTSSQPAKRPAANTAQAPASAAVPTEETVNSFMRHMFGYDPGAKWEIMQIAPSSQIPGMGEVTLRLGQGMVKLYITSDGTHAFTGQPMPFGADPFARTREILKTRANGLSRGPATAPVTIVEFSDPQCPHCAKAQPVIERLLTEEPGVRLIYQPFPLAQHQWARKAAAWQWCAYRSNPEAAWKFIDAVFANQISIDETNIDAKLSELLTTAGGDAAAAATCAASPQTNALLEQSLALGKEAGVEGTPTFYVNGRRVLDVVNTPYEQVKAVVEFEAAEARGAK